MTIATENVSLTPATPTDLPLLAEYLRGLRSDDPMPPETAASDAECIEALRQLLADASIGRAWLIRRDAELVGYVVLTLVHSIEFGGKCAFVDELYVRRESRGQGVGRHALDLVVAAARELGVRMLLLEVSPENERACGLYRSMGFEERKYRLMTRRLDR